MKTSEMKDVVGILNNLGIAGPNDLLAEGKNGDPISDIVKNAPMNTGGTGYGEELTPTEVLSKKVFDAIPEYSSFLSMLPGYHGNTLEVSGKMPILGDAPLAKKGTEHTSGALSVSEGTTPTNFTGKVDYTCEQLYLDIDASTILSDYNILGKDGLETLLREKISKSLARTVEAAIYNGDTITAATGNINSDDGAPDSESYYLGWDGLIKKVIGTAHDINVGSFDFADLLTVASQLGDYFSDPSSCLWLFNMATYLKALGIEQFQDAAKNGRDSTIFKGSLTNILGSDLLVARDLGKAEADGKISTTPTNNTLGRFLIFWKPSVQYGYRGTVNLKMYDFGRKGYQLQGWVNFGMAIVQKQVGVTDSSVGFGRNVTL